MRKSKQVIMVITVFLFMLSVPSYAEVIDINEVLNILGYKYSIEGQLESPTFIDGLESAVKVYGINKDELENVSEKLDVKGLTKEEISLFNYAIDKGILQGIGFVDENGEVKKDITPYEYIAMLINAISDEDPLPDDKSIADKALNLHLFQIEQYTTILDEDFTLNEMQNLTYNALTRTSGLEKMPYWKKMFIDGNITYDQAKEAFDSELKPIEVKDNIMTVGSYDWDYIDIGVEGGKLVIKGIHDDPKYPLLLLSIKNNGTEFQKQPIPKYSDNKFYQSYDVSNLSGTITVDVYCGAVRYGTYYGWANDIKLEKKDGVFEVEKSMVFGENNRRYILMKTDLEEEVYLGSNEHIDITNVDLMNLSQKITETKSTKIGEVRAIYNWVVENLYYDLNQLDSGVHEQINSSYVLEEKRTTCGGFANLTAGLMRARGIPAVIVYGYSLDYAEEKEWSEVNIDTETANHAWLEVFVDGRWMVLDPTWDCRNFYKDGKYTKSQIPGFAYFDPTLEYFSLTHKIIDYREYSY